MSEATIHDFGNEWTPDMVNAMMYQEIRDKEAVKKAQDTRKSNRKKIQSRGIKLRNFDAALSLKFADNTERETFLEDLKEQRRLMQLANVPTGHQFDLVEVAETAEEEDATDKAYFDGKQAYMQGTDEFDCPHAANTAAYQEWQRGFSDMRTSVKVGNEMLAKLDEAMIEPEMSDEDSDEEGGSEDA